MAKKEGTAILYEELDTRKGEVKIYRIPKGKAEREKGQVISTY